MTHFPPEEQAAYEAHMEREKKRFMNEPEVIEFELNNASYFAINNDEWVTIATADGQTLIETSRFASVDELTAKAIVYGYLVGCEVGTMRGREDKAAEIHKALGVSNG